MVNREERLFEQNDPARRNLPFAVAQAMHRQSIPEPVFGELRQSATFDERMYLDNLSVALQSMRSAGVRREEQPDPDGLELVGAAFRMGNSVASAFASEQRSLNLYGDQSERLTRHEVMERARQDGLSPYLHVFGGVDTVARYEAVKADLAREMRDQRMLSSATGWRSTALLLAAGVLDWPTVLPGGSLVAAGRGANLARTVRNVAASAGLDAGLTEAILHQTQVLRTGEETAFNVGAAIFLGGLLGTGVHAAFGPGIARRVENRTQRLIDEAQDGFHRATLEGNTIARQIERHIQDGTMGTHRLEIDPSTGAFRFAPPRAAEVVLPDTLPTNVLAPERLTAAAKQSGKTVEEVRAEVLAGLSPAERRAAIATEQELSGSARKRASVGASGVDADAQLAARGLDKSDRLRSLGAFESLEAVGKVPVVGTNLRIPRLELENGLTRQERRFVDQMGFNPSISRHQVPGVTSPDGTPAPRSVSADMARYQGEFAQAIHEVSDIFKKNQSNYTNIDDFAKRVTIALVNGDKSADSAVQRAAEIFRSRVFEPIKDAHIKNGNFIEGLQPRNASSYFPLVLDTAAIRADKDRFIAYHEAAFFRELEEEFRLAQVEKQARLSDRETTRVDANIERQGTTAEVRAEHDENIRSLRETRENEVAQFERDATDMREKLRAERDQSLEEIRTTRDEMVSGDIDSAEIRANSREARDARIESARTTHKENENRIRTEKANALAGHEQDARGMREKIAAERSDALSARKEDETAAGVRKQFEREAAQLERNLKKERTAIAKRFDDELEASRKARDKEVKAARDEATKAIDDADTERARIDKSHDAEAKRINATYQRELKTLEVRLARERKDLTKKFDAKEAEARTLRDEAIGEAQSRADALKDASKELGLSEGLSVLRFATRDAREAQASKLADAYYNAAVGNWRFLLDHEVQNGTRGYAKYRSSPIWHQDAIDKGWAKHNVFDIADHYVRSAGTDAALGSAFKRTGKQITNADGSKTMEMIGDPSLSSLKAEVREEYKNLIASAGSPEREIALGNVRDRAIQNIDYMRDFSRGMQPTEGNAALMKAAEMVGTLNYVRLLGGQLISSLTDPVNITIANGFGNAMRYGIMPMLTNFNEAYRAASSKARELARLTNANTEIELNSRIVQAAELGNPHAQVDAGTAWMRWAAKTFSSATGITFWNSFWKQVAYNTAQARIVQHALAGWDTVPKVERTWLNNLGIGRDGLESIRVSYLAQKGESTIGGTVPLARFTEWEDARARDLFQAAMSNESHNMLVTPHWSDKMALNINPASSLITQFKRYPIATQMRVIGRNVQLASIDDTASKRLALGSGLFGLVMMGAVVDGVKQIAGTTTITGGNTDPNRNAFARISDEWSKTPGTALYNAMDRSGIFGIVFEGSNILERIGMPNIRGGMSLALGDDHGSRREANRFANRSMLESIGGPTVGLIEDVGKLGAFGSNSLGYLFGIVEDPHFNRSDFRRLRRSIPFQNLPGIQQAINEVEAYGGTVFHWPAPR